MKTSGSGLGHVEDVFPISLEKGEQTRDPRKRPRTKVKEEGTWEELVENAVTVSQISQVVELAPDLKREVKEEAQPGLQECTSTVEKTDTSTFEAARPIPPGRLESSEEGRAELTKVRAIAKKFGKRTEPFAPGPVPIE